MTTTNNAAQAATNDDITQRALTDDEIAAHFRRFWAFSAYEQDNLMAAARAVIADALSKLRAPVADERAAYVAWHVSYASRMPNLDSPTGHWADDKKAWDAWQERARRAALASAPVAGEATDTFRNLLLEAVHRYGNARAMAEHDIKQRGQISKTVAAILDLLDAAPQASEAVRNAALEEAIAAVLRDSYVGMPSHTANCHSAARIRALKQPRPQADKDGGQQRAGDAADAARYRLAVADCILILRGDAALGRAEWDRKLDNLARTKGAA